MEVKKETKKKIVTKEKKETKKKIIKSDEKEEKETKNKIEESEEKEDSKYDTDEMYDTDEEYKKYMSHDEETRKKMRNPKYMCYGCLTKNPDWINAKEWVDFPHICLHYNEWTYYKEEYEDLKKCLQETEELYYKELNKNRKISLIMSKIKELNKIIDYTSDEDLDSDY